MNGLPTFVWILIAAAFAVAGWFVGYIYRKNNHIAIDCGACFPGGRLAAICLDTGEEFYSE